MLTVQKLMAAAAVALLLASAAIADPERVDGVVTKVDQAGARITIRHGPMKKFDMDEGMTMVFRVTDPAMLAAVKPGDKIKFEADRINGQFTVTRIERAR